MIVYTERHTNWWMTLMMVALAVWMVYAFAVGLGDAPITWWALILVILLVPVLIILLFYGMRTSVDDEYIHVAYGVGWIKRKVALKEIGNVKITKIPWYNGAGIKQDNNGGIIYTVDFTPGVKMRLRRGNSVTIGSRSPEKLAAEIAKRLA